MVYCSMAMEVASNEDLLREILLRLPVKPLLRFKCVSKHWLTLISEPRFCHSHTLRQYHSPRPFPSALLLCTTDTSRCTIIPLQGSDSSPNFRHVKVNPRTPVTVKQSCKGLLLLQGKGKSLENHNMPLSGSYFVYNPTTNQFVAVNFPTLQFGSSLISLFLSFEPLRSPHYKLISITGSDTRFRGFSVFSETINYGIATSSQHDYVVNVYSSETGSWSDPGVCFTAPDDSQAVYCNGAIYWYSNDVNSKYFDVENQCFKTLPMPLGITDNQKIKYFGESGGHLHLVVQSLVNFELDILELNEDRSGWSVRFHMNLHHIQVAYPQWKLYDFWLRLIGILSLFRQEREVDSISMLVFFIGGRIVAYNLVDSTLRDLSYFVRFITASRCDFFHYYENLSWVGPSDAY